MNLLAVYTESIETVSIYSLFLHQEDCGVPAPKAHKGLTQRKTPSHAHTYTHTLSHHPLVGVCLIWHFSMRTVYPAPIFIRALLMQY